MFIQQVFAERMQCMELAGRVRLQQQVQVAGRHCMREAQSGSQCQVGKTQPQRTDERRDLYSECDGKLGAGE